MLESLLRVADAWGLRTLWQFHVANLPRIVHLVPIAFALLAFCLFAYIGQLHEIYLSIIEQDDRLHFLIGLSLVALLSSANFAAALALTEKRASIVYGAMADVQLSPALLFVRFLFALACGLLPIAGVALGVWKVQELIARTIHSGTLAAGATLVLPGLAASSEAAAFGGRLWHVAALLGIAFLFVLACKTLASRSVGIWRFWAVNWRLELVKSIAMALLPVALVHFLLWLPAALSSDPKSEILLTSLLRAGQYYVAGALLGAGLLCLAVISLRNSHAGFRMVILACIVIAIPCLLGLPLLAPAALLAVTKFCGPLAMVAAQYLTVFTVFMLLYAMSRRIGVPVILLLVVAIPLHAWYRATQIPYLSPDAATGPAKQVAREETEVARQFGRWLDRRAEDRKRFAAGYPVFVIAVQGGGIYAASAAATFLARLQDICPHFSRHVFAVSAASGGAIGAALFSATVTEPTVPGDPTRARPLGDCERLAQEGASLPGSDPHSPEPAPSAKTAPTASRIQPVSHSDSLRWVLTQDHISPVLGLVTPDYAGKLMFGWPTWLYERLVRSGTRRTLAAPDNIRAIHRIIAHESIDLVLTRANALEASLSCAVNARPGARTVERACDSDVIREGMGPYKDQFKLQADRPALLLNTTFVETGQRVVFSPFRLRELGEPSLASFTDIGFESRSDELVDNPGPSGAKHDAATDEAARAGREARTSAIEAVDNMTVAEAAVASARFPGLMPALSLASPRHEIGQEQRRPQWNFVDGGYADNSGAATASAVVEALNAYIDRNKSNLGNVVVRLIILTNEEREPRLETIAGTALVDTRAPVEALLNVRSTLAAREVGRAVERFAPEWRIDRISDRLTRKWRVGVIRLDNSNFTLELGWKIPRTTNHVVSLFVARPELCTQRVAQELAPSTEGPPATPGAEELKRSAEALDERAKDQAVQNARLITSNACLISDVVELLRPR